MELIEGSETSANYNLTPGKYPKENIPYLELSRIEIRFVGFSARRLVTILTELTGVTNSVEQQTDEMNMVREKELSGRSTGGKENVTGNVRITYH